MCFKMMLITDKLRHLRTLYACGRPESESTTRSISNIEANFSVSTQMCGSSLNGLLPVQSYFFLSGSKVTKNRNADQRPIAPKSMAQPTLPIQNSNAVQAKQLPEINTRVHNGRNRGSSNSNIGQPCNGFTSLEHFSKEFAPCVTSLRASRKSYVFNLTDIL